MNDRPPAFDTTIIGAGHMGQALRQGWCFSGVSVGFVRMCGRSDVLAERSRPRGKESRLYVLAVKPEDVPTATKQYARALKPGDWLISVAAGAAPDPEQLPDGVHIGRAMPNVAVEVGCGLVGFATAAPEGEKNKSVSHLEGLGQFIELQDDQFDAFTVFAGCGPAYLAAFSATLRDMAVESGIVVDERALQTLLAGVLQHSEVLGLAMRDYAESIAVPGSVTRSGMAAFDENDHLKLLTRECYDRAMNHCRQLSAHSTQVPE